MTTTSRTTQARRLAVGLRGLLLLLVLGVAANQVLRGRWRTPAEPEGGQAAPAFTLSDTEGKPIALDSYRGRVVALNFWATWCPPCLQEIPDLVRVRAAHPRDCFEVVGVATQSPAEDVPAVARRLGVSYPILLDAGSKAADLYRVPALPRTFLIDAQGKIRTVFRGALEREELESALAPLLRENASACPKA